MTPRERLRRTIFEADTPAGRAFDVALIVAILASVTAAILESVSSIRAAYGETLYAIEWFFTVLFTVEYALRLWAVQRPLHYARSFFGIIDLLAILPTYVSVLIPGAQQLLTIRVLRLLRIFRVFKLANYLSEARIILTALQASVRKISVFILAVITLVTFFGSVMYVVEGPEHGYTSVPTGVYWAVVTLTTVGYGDISPQTPLGQGLSVIVMLMGYAIIAVPTGIVTVELSRAGRPTTDIACPGCGRQGHDPDAEFCKYCATEL
ncbi:ion transporter [Vulgatibacter sp.]|uniref:ion transporter n=1 Tax=Vulgatibacter sp. TaxID=1971226 RepID=UPI0035625319